MARTDVWYQCADCKVRRRGAPGMLFCGDCGGELRSIGRVERNAASFQSPPRRRRRSGW